MSIKKITYKLSFALILAGGMTSCSLDEWNPSTVDVETAYKYKDGFESLINYCYDGLYYFYGKVDGIGAMEMGTDLWTNVGNTESGFILYNSNMNAQLGTLNTIWNGLYSTVNYCNTAIHYATLVQGYTDAERNQKVAEAYFLRGWANWHLVEQFGGVALTTIPSSVSGVISSPTRSSEEQFYDLIIEDLKFAAANLPDKPAGERGRVTKKAAYAMLAKAYLQRTRLGGNTQEYAKLALEAAEELINNGAKYGVALYESDNNTSGYAKLWAGSNNKNNTEFLFLEAVDHVDGRNPEGWNRGRTRQYYLMDARTVGAPWGTQENDAVLGRANSRIFKPTKYLLTEIFEPVRNPADTRFSETFFYEYYNATWADKTITSAMVTQYRKNPNLIGHVIKNTAATGSSLVQGNRAINHYGLVNMVDNDNDGYLDGLSIYTPNYVLPVQEKADLPFWVADPSDWFDAEGKWITAQNNTKASAEFEIFPSLKKFSSKEYVYDRQYWMGDIPIIRLGEVFLIAAEAAIINNNDVNKAQQYINTLRKRAAVKSRENEMIVDASKVNLDFILAERARELAGEQTRWYDLKRAGKLTTAYLRGTNPEILTFDPSKHSTRPIPQTFLDAIANPTEFGQNTGY
ncbi:RagB/SusD family nutrient uptake outer membrane protein [Sphingobacterium cavernae]|uniref:RagB/SusD family nutrient uptake outer membrane protein n=1 Tax=Sphingobacterium cavernae TaxID=2592657 RepID=UPI00122FC834|nr:RagB/SusD family nutrient uptake outer membrane protein [Sphingobacterium cavernae]